MGTFPRSEVEGVGKALCQLLGSTALGREAHKQVQRQVDRDAGIALF